jgi:formamidopyrimidine-DNA glycosylase
MPELPEVETIRRHLAPRVESRTLRTLEVLDPRWTRPLPPAEVTAAVEGREIRRLARRGKYLVWELAGDAFLVMHLRMTGTLLLDPRGAPPYTRAWLRLTGHDLAFADQRRFGTGELALGPAALEAFFAARLGVEPLGDGFTSARLHALTSVSRAPIKAFLLDQKRIAGVGNIYADEALFRARIHPLRPANRLTRAQTKALHEAVVATLEDGIEAKGATIDDFRAPDGVSGAFQDRFLVHTREGEPCPRCGHPIRKLRAAGRGTYVCERCQPKPRQGGATRSPEGYAAAASSARPPSRSTPTSS